MSLTSRVYNLFASEPSYLVPVPPTQELDGSQHDSSREDGAGFGISQITKGMRSMEKTEVDEDFELKRPPYLHVRYQKLVLGVRHADTLTGNAQWGNWRHER